MTRQHGESSVAELFTLLVGKWYIHRSTLPLWLNGDKHFPSLNYSIDSRHPNYLGDCVMYKTKPLCSFLSSNAVELVDKSIVGWNSVLDLNSKELQWRGTGLLYPITSNWRVVAVDVSQRYAVIYFSKTMFTPEGMDVISKDAAVDDVTRTRMDDLVKAAAASCASCKRLESFLQPVPVE